MNFSSAGPSPWILGLPAKPEAIMDTISLVEVSPSTEIML